MQTIQFQIEDSKVDTFLTLLDNLKDGMVKNLVIKQDELDDDTKAYMKTEQFQKDKASLQQSLKDIKSGKTKTLSHDEVWNSIDEYTKVS